MTIRKNRISVLYNKGGNESQLTGWYKVRGKTTLKVCMEAPFTGLSNCEEVAPNISSPKELESIATQHLQKLYEDANEIMQYRDKLERVIAEFHQAVEAKKRKRADVESSIVVLHWQTIGTCLMGKVLTL